MPHSGLEFLARTVNAFGMSIIDPIYRGPGSQEASPRTQSKPLQVSFNRSELNQILSVYGRRVAAGEWRDYAIDFNKDAAVFSIFRRSSEMPLYRIEKRPKLRARQGQFSVLAPAGLIIKRGHDLGQVLAALDKKKKTLELVE